MNQRIQELAVKAGATVNERSGWTDYGTIDLDVEKFAESIVRECAEVAGCNGHVSGFSLGDLIKQHFGVEQPVSQKMAAAGYTRRPRGWTREGEE
jgi:hypothetical protein